MAKAEAAEQKASVAKDAMAREQAWREAARLWDRAADHESDAKRRQQYTDKAEAARGAADEPDQNVTADAREDDNDDDEITMTKSPRILN